MKTLTSRPLLLLLLGLLGFSTSLFGGKRDSVPSIENTVEIKGRVQIPDWDLAKNYKIELLCHNVVIESETVVDGEDFLLRVNKNSLYTIRITKPGYSPMVVSINSRLQDPTGGYKYNFDNLYFLDLHGFQLALTLKN